MFNKKTLDKSCITQMLDILISNKIISSKHAQEVLTLTNGKNPIDQLIDNGHLTQEEAYFASSCVIGSELIKANARKKHFFDKINNIQKSVEEIVSLSKQLSLSVK